MAVSDAAAERLRALYADELRRSLRPPVHSKVNARQTRALIRHAREGGPGLCEVPDAATWVWSDLHLGHEDSLTTFDRPISRLASSSSRLRSSVATWVSVSTTPSSGVFRSSVPLERRQGMLHRLQAVARSACAAGRRRAV